MKQKISVSLFLVIFLLVTVPACIHKNNQEAQSLKSRSTSNYGSDKEHHTISQMSFHELEYRKNKLLANGDKESAVKFLKQMIKVCEDLPKLHDIMLELADALFDLGSLKEAELIYRQFCTFYPGTKEVEYAQYKSILCSFYLTLSPDRDQTKTKETLELAQKFLSRKDTYSTHITDVEKIAYECQEKLAESEIGIIDFYTHRGAYISAQQRIDHLRKEFTTAMPNLEPRLINLECNIAQASHNQELFEQKQLELHTKFPNFVLAQNYNKSKKPAIDRF